MRHLGDITKINGYEVPIVDCVIGGSPCQDLSIAGKREGLNGARSGLFMEQIRIIREMRENDRKSGTDGAIRPRYMVWENVPGALSSNKGEDFRIVLEETARIADQNAVIPRPEKWRTSGCIMGDGWSISWRVLDAQFWGVPQRRRRIALVADFGGHSAPEILFVRKGVCGDIESSGKAGEGTSETAERGVRKNVSYTLKIRAGCDGGGKGALIQTDKSATLGCNNDQTLFQPIGINGEIAATLDASYYKGAGMRSGVEHEVVATYATKSYAEIVEDDISATLKAEGGAYGGGSENYVIENHGIDARYTGPVEVTPTLTSYLGTGGNNTPLNVTVGERFTVRKLTPLECERLQGYPDGWTDIGEYTDSTGKKRKTSDSARYKALGNSIALPPWKWVLKRLCACYERDATMASLFDGIGGFPLIWEQLNGEGTCLWASEIEEFPMAVTKRRFGG